MESNIVEDVRYIFFMMEHFVLVVIFILGPNQSDHRAARGYYSPARTDQRGPGDSQVALHRFRRSPGRECRQGRAAIRLNGCRARRWGARVCSTQADEGAVAASASIQIAPQSPVSSYPSAVFIRL